MPRDGKMMVGAAPLEIADLLCREGGWWTIDMIATEVNVHPDTARRALYRLQERHMVRSEIVRGDYPKTVYSRWRWQEVSGT